MSGFIRGAWSKVAGADDGEEAWKKEMPMEFSGDEEDGDHNRKQAAVPDEYAVANATEILRRAHEAEQFRKRAPP